MLAQSFIKVKMSINLHATVIQVIQSIQQRVSP